MGGEPFSEGLPHFHAAPAAGGHLGTSGMASLTGPVASCNIGTAGFFLVSASFQQPFSLSQNLFFNNSSL
jgi:hypothetical protein